MTAGQDQSGAGPSAEPRVAFARLDRAAVDALARGDLAGASAAAGVALSPYFVAAENESMWRIRAEQLAADPGEAAWTTAALLDAGSGVVVGIAGFHGPPDAAGMVEVGYAVDPEWRRRGYARAALRALLERAAREPEVRTVRASIGPENEPSRTLVLAHGFTEVGEQWDEEDGIEIVFERRA